MKITRAIAIGIGVAAIILVALLASRENTAQRSPSTLVALVPSVAPTEPRLLVKAPSPIIGTATPSPLPDRTFTPKAALRGMGKLLFVCDPVLCLLDADGTNLKRIAPQDTGGVLLTPRWSPDGRVFAAQYFPHWSDGGLRWAGQVLLFSADGALLGSFSPGDKNLLGSPWLAWSPDGRWFAFSAVLDENGSGYPDSSSATGQVRILDRQTWSEAFAALRLSGFASSSLAWSPDSRRLAFSVQSEPPTPVAPYGESSEVYLFDSKSGQMRRINGTDPSWGPDSQEFVFVADDGLKLQTFFLTSSKAQTSLSIEEIRSFLAKDDPWLPKGKLRFAMPAWSPDGVGIAFRVWGTADEPFPKYFPGMMFILSAGPDWLARLPDTDTPNTALQTWSPGGEHLAFPFFIMGDGRYYPNPAAPSPQRRFTYKEGADLIVYDRKTGTWWDEAGIRPQTNGELSGWSPDGKWFATAAARQSGLTVFSVDNPAQRWSNEELTVDDVQWQPSPR